MGPFMHALLATPLVAILAVGAGSSGGGCCGGYSGAGDRAYQRGTESLIMCANHGFVAQLAAGPLEGTYVETAPSSAGTATTGATGTPAFDYTIAADMSLSAPQLGDGVWTQQTLNQTELDHADVQCTDLQMRPWWTVKP
jgi:hypothetical protein